jgi:hypothetical protein
LAELGTIGDVAFRDCAARTLRNILLAITWVPDAGSAAIPKSLLQRFPQAADNSTHSWDMMAVAIYSNSQWAKTELVVGAAVNFASWFSATLLRSRDSQFSTPPLGLSPLPSRRTFLGAPGYSTCRMCGPEKSLSHLDGSAESGTSSGGKNV